METYITMVFIKVLFRDIEEIAELLGRGPVTEEITMIIEGGVRTRVSDSVLGFGSYGYFEVDVNERDTLQEFGFILDENFINHRIQGEYLRRKGTVYRYVKGKMQVVRKNADVSWYG